MMDSLVLKDHIYITRFMREVRWKCYTAERFFFVINQEHDSWCMKEFCGECLTSFAMIYPSFLENSK